jgi:hypothetical protein
MTLTLKPGPGAEVTRLAGIAAIAAGALLLGQIDPSASTWAGALASRAMHVDWLLLAGLVCILGGGLLLQITWERRHE